MLRRLDSVLAETKPAVLAAVADAAAQGVVVRPALLRAKAGHTHSFHNTSPYDLARLVGDPDNLRENLLLRVGLHQQLRDRAELDAVAAD